MTMWFTESSLCFSGLLPLFFPLGSTETLAWSLLVSPEGTEALFWIIQCTQIRGWRCQALGIESSSLGLFSGCLFLLRLFLQSLLVLPGKGRATFCFLGKDQEMAVLSCLLLVGLVPPLLQDGRIERLGYYKVRKTLNNTEIMNIRKSHYTRIEIDHPKENFPLLHPKTETQNLMERAQLWFTGWQRSHCSDTSVVLLDISLLILWEEYPLG